MKIAFAGTGYINKIHAIAARNAGSELAAVLNHKAESMEKFAAEFDIHRRYGRSAPCYGRRRGCVGSLDAQCLYTDYHQLYERTCNIVHHLGEK
jgi:predicted dehydrogenase